MPREVDRKKYSHSPIRAPLNLPPATKQLILSQQNNKCIYCNYAFGSMFRDKKRHCYVTLVVNWDHFIPWTYTQSHPTEPSAYVAACQICNKIKYSKMFQTLADACTYILGRRKDRYFYEIP